MLLLVWMSGEQVPPWQSFGWGVVAGVTDAFGVAALYKGLSTGRMGVVAPVASVMTAMLPVLFGIGVEGLPSRTQLLGFALAGGSLWLITRPEGRLDSRRGLGLALLAGLMFSLLLISGKEAGRYAVLWPLVSARAASTVLMSAIVLLAPRDRQPLRPALMPIVLSGVLDSIANAMFIAATRHGRLDVAAVLSSLYPASTVILARVLLKERISRIQAVGIFGGLAAVALISAR
jgi:drug/metabolite transporter (DMT)-like permease